MKKTVFNITVPLIIFSMMTACTDKADITPDVTTPDDVETRQQTQRITQQDTPAPDKPPSVMRSADSHTHGDSELAIVLEDNVVTIELESPLYNLLGFEHHPETATQKTKVKMVQSQLQQGEDLFAFNSEAKCSLVSESKTVELFEEDHEDPHKDVLLQYQYRCAAPASLSNVSVNLFEFFEDMSDIDVTYLGRATQKQVSMTRKNTQMKLSR